jgi:predicted permease
MTLALFGGIAALAAARWGGDILRSALLPGVDWSTAGSGPQLLMFVGVTAVIAGIASALMPALQSTRGDVNDALRASAGAITRSALRTRGFLSVAQAALSVLLLIGAGLFVRSLTRIGDLDTGFVMDDLYVADFVSDANGTFDDDARRAFLDRAIESIARLPAVTGTAAASSTPFLNSSGYGLEVPGLDSIPQRQTGGPYGQAVTPGYFAAMGIRVVRGRALTEEDRVGAPAALVVNEAFAELVWPGEDAIGKCVHVKTEKDKPLPPCAAVVGIVATARRGSLNEERTAQYYVPVAQALVPTAPNALFIRVRPGSRDLSATLRSELLGLEPRLRDANVRPMIDLAAYELRPWRLGATLFSAFGLIALVVAALGLYSVLAFDVAQRQREIGLRSALGARVGDVLALVLGRAARLTLAGIALGVSAALLLAPRLGDLLFDTAPRDPLTFTVVTLTLLAVGALAAAIPALRATRVDPNVALRSE